MSFPHHLIKVSTRYYYKIKVPADIRPHFPCAFIKKSLKTSDLQSAKLLLVAMEYRTQRVFTLLRTGMLTDSVLKQTVNSILPTKQKQVAVKGKVLADAISEYTKAKRDGWTNKTKMESSGVCKLLLEILGNVEIAAISRPIVLELRSTLQKLPPNIHKKYPKMTIQQVIGLKDLKPMSTKTVNKHVTKLGSILRYCVDEGIISSNPALGLKISAKHRPDEERSAYTHEDVANIITHLPNDHSKPERYWAPLLGLYSGMRLNEVSQLYVSDIIEYDDLWCFSINDEKDKRIKNDASERVIPIHPTLINLGFLNYVEGLRKKNVPRLWMNLTYCKINGYSNSLGKWYQRFNREYVTTDSKKVYHSMRHLVTNTLKQAGVLETVIAECVGHSNSGSMTMGRYGKRYQPKVLLEALTMLDYGITPTKVLPIVGHLS